MNKPSYLYFWSFSWPSSEPTWSAQYLFCTGNSRARYSTSGRVSWGQSRWGEPSTALTSWPWFFSCSPGYNRFSGLHMQPTHSQLMSNSSSTTIPKSFLAGLLSINSASNLYWYRGLSWPCQGLSRWHPLTVYELHHSAWCHLNSCWGWAQTHYLHYKWKHETALIHVFKKLINCSVPNSFSKQH